MNPADANKTKAYLNVESDYDSNFNDKKTTGLYTMYDSSLGRYGVLAVFATSHFICQYYGYSNGVTYRRYSVEDDTWGTWEDL